MKNKPPAPGKAAPAGRVSRYQRLLALREKGGVPGPAAKDKPGAGADSYQVIAQAIRAMLREP